MYDSKIVFQSILEETFIIFQDLGAWIFKVWCKESCLAWAKGKLDSFKASLFLTSCKQLPSLGTFPSLLYIVLCTSPQFEDHFNSSLHCLVHKSPGFGTSPYLLYIVLCTNPQFWDLFISSLHCLVHKSPGFVTFPYLLYIVLCTSPKF